MQSAPFTKTRPRPARDTTRRTSSSASPSPEASSRGTPAASSRASAGWSAGELEEGLHRGLVRTLPEDVGAHAAAEHEVEGADEERLARPGLPGEHVQSRAEADLHLVHHRETRDAQGRQHGREFAIAP